MENQTDVTQESSPETPEQETVNVEEQVTVQPESIDVSNIQATPPGPDTGNQSVDEVDERGVSYENVAREYQRKLEKSESRLSQMEEVLGQIQQNTAPQEQEYTIADLEAYKQQNPQYAAWCEEEKAKVMQKNMLAAFREEQQAAQKAQQAEYAKKEELRSVVSSYPQMFNRDSNGNVLSWNPQNPLTQQTSAYLNQGHALSVASKLAYADLAQSGLLQASKQAVAQQAQVGDLQRRVAVEGGGVNGGATNPNAEAMGRVKQTGDRQAASQIMGNILRATGKIQD